MLLFLVSRLVPWISEMNLIIYSNAFNHVHNFIMGLNTSPLCILNIMQLYVIKAVILLRSLSNIYVIRCVSSSWYKKCGNDWHANAMYCNDIRFLCYSWVNENENEINTKTKNIICTFIISSIVVQWLCLYKCALFYVLVPSLESISLIFLE